MKTKEKSQELKSIEAELMADMDRQIGEMEAHLKKIKETPSQTCVGEEMRRDDIMILMEMKVHAMLNKSIFQEHGLAGLLLRVK
jgi:hypothetical protein